MNSDLLALTPELVLFIKKLVQHSRGGLTKDGTPILFVGYDSNQYN